MSKEINEEKRNKKKKKIQAQVFFFNNLRRWKLVYNKQRNYDNNGNGIRNNRLKKFQDKTNHDWLTNIYLTNQKKKKKKCVFCLRNFLIAVKVTLKKKNEVLYFYI